jgi:hypothetical protein
MAIMAQMYKVAGGKEKKIGKPRVAQITYPIIWWKR